MMADISEGLSEAGAEPVGDAFATALAAKFESAGGDPMAGISNDAATEPAPEAPARGDDGRFLPKEDAPAAPAAATPLAADTSTGDPAVDAYLAKYDGDVDAAVKAAAHQADLLGRQGQELGQTRQELAKLQGIVETLQAAQTAPTGPTMTADQVEEYAVEVSTSKGYHEGATQLINESLKTGDERAYDTLLRNWALEDPVAATRYDGEYQAWKRAQNAPQPEAAPADPRLASVLERAEVDSITAAITAVAQERGATWAATEPFMEAALEQVDPTVLALIASSEPSERLRGTRAVADKAQLMALTNAGGKTPAEVAAEAAEARKRAGASVATGSLRPADPVGDGAPSTKAEEIAALKRSIVEADTALVSEGLTGL